MVLPDAAISQQEVELRNVLTGDSSAPRTPKPCIPSPTVSMGDSSSDETTTVGSGRSMSIFESFDDLFLGFSPDGIQPRATPIVSPTPFPPRSSPMITPREEHGRGDPATDRLNAEASALVKEHGRKGDLNTCWLIWNNLIEKTTVPNEITVGCMVDALVSNGEVRYAESLVNQWKHRVKPNTVVYSTLIHGWAKQNDSKHALAIFDQMRAENVACNAVTYNCVIHACVRVGDMQGSMDLLSSMKTSSFPAVRPDKFTYSTIIKGFCGRGEINSALFLFDQMLSEGLTPDLVIYNTLLDGCVKTRHNEVCDRMLEDMTSRWRIHPNSYTLSILIKRFGRQGDLIRAFHLVDDLPRKYAFKANAHVWTCLISACVTHGRMRLAECLFASMQGYSGKVRILLHGANAELDTATDVKLLSTALAMASNCLPDAKTYETLAQGYLRFSEPRKAVELLVDGLSKFRGRINHQCISQVAQAAVQSGIDISQLTNSLK